MHGSWHEIRQRWSCLAQADVTVLHFVLLSHRRPLLLFDHPNLFFLGSHRDEHIMYNDYFSATPLRNNIDSSPYTDFHFTCQRAWFSRLLLHWWSKDWLSHQRNGKKLSGCLVLKLESFFKKIPLPPSRYRQEAKVLVICQSSFKNPI